MEQVKAHSLDKRTSDEAEHLPKELIALPSTSSTHAVCPLGPDCGLNSLSLGDHGAVPELRYLQDYFSTTDSVSYVWKKPCHCYYLNDIMFYCNNTGLGTTCPNKTAPLWQPLKEQMWGRRDGTGIYDNSALWGSNETKIHSILILFYHCQYDKKQHSYQRNMKPINWICSQKVLP